MLLQKYPSTNFHELNLDWIINEIKKLTNEVETFKVVNKISFAGPWDITKQYQAWTVVNTEGHNGYLSIKPVPSGVSLENTDYWVLVANYDEIYADFQNRVVALEGSVNTVNTTLQNVITDIEHFKQLGTDYFKNKSICIIGDSMSDNNTNPPNWTIEFTRIVTEAGATSVTNIAHDGESFASFANTTMDLPVADIYVLFLGINDYIGQWPWKGQINEFNILACADNVFAQIINKNINADFFYISPLKLLSSLFNDKIKPLNWYRKLLENRAARWGFTVISGYCAPSMTPFSTQRLSDSLHPTTEYGTKIFSRYVISNMITKASSFTPVTPKKLSIEPINGSGYINLVSLDDFKVSITAVINNVLLQPGWNDLIPLPDCFTQNTADLPIAFYNVSNNAWYMLNMTDTHLQVYSGTQATVNLAATLAWNCVHNALLENY